MAENQEWVTPNAFSKLVGVSAQAVSSAIETGRFSSDALKREKTKTGKDRYKINVELGIPQWDLNKKEPSFTKSVTDEEYVQAKMREQVAKAEIEEMKSDELAGKLIRSDLVAAHFFKITTVLRDGVLNEAIKLAPIISNMDDAKEIENKMLASFTKVLEEYAKAGQSGAIFKQDSI